MEYYIGVLADEGVTFVPVWTEPKKEEPEPGGPEKGPEDAGDSEKKPEGGATVAQVSSFSRNCVLARIKTT